MQQKTFVIEGSRINAIPDFYAEINRLFMAGEDWKLGNSLDGFNDLLHGGFGAITGDERVVLVWKDIAHSKAALGVEATRKYYEEKLSPGAPFNRRYFEEKLKELEEGRGQTYFDIVMEIIADHPDITVVSA
ncbi:ribonuclease inhibitor [Chitinophaga oryzae]|uniref:Ribonuclease inhibitor n=1 Tax=Chitinophaga oryzae TaxID=2725414 RepID=A0AAE6ZG10_9BACT|nr:ribonuclease inhibitor [Chitinophaga oryzae]QJB31941.1 ribonuclease inhibitor [Chitinophaga oryzae]QJB38420.1 ribonuclease inhibitor [Chitinophaga oryzae]